jgi:hypothetical protein
MPVQLTMFSAAEVPERPRILVINMWASEPGSPCERCGPECCGTHRVYDGDFTWWACNGSCDCDGQHLG